MPSRIGALYISCPVYDPHEDLTALTVETLLVRDIIHQQDSHGASIVCRCDRAKAFLPSRIPDLKLHSLSIQLNRPNLEVDSDGAGDVQVVSGMRVSAWAAARVANPPVSRPRPPGLT